MAVRTRTRLTRGSSADVEGFADLHQALKGLTRATARNTLKKSSKIAMQPMVEAARQYAPVKTGRLQNSIALKVGIDDAGFRARARASFSAKGHARGIKKTKGGGDVLSQITAGGNLAPHASLIELGSVRITAHPFLRPAFDGGVRGAIDRLRETLTVEIRKALARRAKKLAKG